ncbi:hypothetical protein [Paracoccus alkenifer]|uniref:Cellulose biosynthesis protein BcsS n=1 Tax=Paracoccus alkenifer TaxID=65735 RepID=A0A1H6L5A6_9RHOB|nr:hypothetical protein [Paracoccus alkenifer]SEH83361.1 hypothetical protein SAMN04488075_1329 [Paracoccus alkenifer]
MHLFRLLCLLTALHFAAGPGHAADGTWVQLDLHRDGGQLVVNVEKGRVVWGMTLGEDADDSWARASALYTWQVGPEHAPWKLRAGPALKAERIDWWRLDDYRWSICLEDRARCGALRAGWRLSADRWAEYGDWGVFLMADFTSIDRARLAVAGATHQPSGWGGQLSLWHESGGKLTPAVMLTRRLSRRLTLRLGHKFTEDETFLGLSFSTY